MTTFTRFHAFVFALLLACAGPLFAQAGKAQVQWLGQATASS